MSSGTHTSIPNKNTKDRGTGEVGVGLRDPGGGEAGRLALICLRVGGGAHPRRRVVRSGLCRVTIIGHQSRGTKQGGGREKGVVRDKGTRERVA
jgi:hypothetical protein